MDAPHFAKDRCLPLPLPLPGTSPYLWRPRDASLAAQNRYVYSWRVSSGKPINACMYTETMRDGQSTCASACSMCMRARMCIHVHVCARSTCRQPGFC